MIYFKEGVYAGALRAENCHAINTAHYLRQEIGFPDTYVTSLHDGQHTKNSFHYKDLACDIRTHDMEEDQKQNLYDKLILTLSADYDVVYHDTHIHIEYDP